jgi:hypothetical protein
MSILSGCKKEICICIKIRSLLITHITPKWPLPTMHEGVCFQKTLMTEWLMTYVTGKWPLPSMYVLVCLQMTLITEWFITYITICMRWCVFRLLWSLNDLFITCITGKWLLPSMYVLVCLRMTLLTEWLISYITAKWPLPSMYALMCL